MDTLFAKNCEFLRKSKNWKQSEIEGFSISTWSNYENSRSVPGFDDLIKISKLFEVSLDDLLFSDLSKKMQGKPKNVKKYSSAEKEENLSIVEDKGSSPEINASLQQRMQVLENRLTKLEILVKKIADKL
jgi:transcriptional regulator with XRE-family HTH domain